MIFNHSKDSKISECPENMKQKIPVVSIGMPVYNGERFIKEAIKSILDQTFEDFELIISDNASTDRTQKICQYYVKKDSRIRYYRSRINHGAAWNYNHVYKLSRGKYFKWAAHDDVCASKFIEKCVNGLDQNKSAVLCYPRTLIIDENTKVIKKDPKRLNLMSNSLHKRFKIYLYNSGGECNSVFGLFRSFALKKTSLIKNYMASDVVLLGHLSLLGMFHEVAEELFFRRDHPGTSVRANRNSSMVTQWFDPQKKGEIVFPHWRHLSEYIFCILNSDLLLIEKMHCMMQLSRWIRWRLKPLIEDLSTGAKLYYARSKKL
jgi:glycosyltransferase involved in cell wall biosynthesis